MKIRKRCVTLIEMLIVMFLIAMIIGVVAYNYQGSLDEGKAFKTKTAIEKIQTALMLREAEGVQIEVSNWEEELKASPMVQKASQLAKDGWGEKFQVGRDSEGNFEVTSRKFEDYKKKNPGTYFKDGDNG